MRLQSTLFALITIFAIQVHAGQPYVANTNPGIGPIAVIGDSLANGRGAKEEANKPLGCLAAHFPGAPQGFAVDGRTSEELLLDLNAPTQLLPHLVFVSSGGNDAITDFYYGGYPESRSLSEMGEIFDRLLATGAVVVYLGLNPPKFPAERLPKISDLARQRGIIVVDGMVGIWNTDMMNDQFHPNDKGYQLMCTRIVDAVRAHYP